MVRIVMCTSYCCCCPLLFLHLDLGKKEKRQLPEKRDPCNVFMCVCLRTFQSLKVFCFCMSSCSGYFELITIKRRDNEGCRVNLAKPISLSRHRTLHKAYTARNLFLAHVVSYLCKISVFKCDQSLVFIYKYFIHN